MHDIIGGISHVITLPLIDPCQWIFFSQKSVPCEYGVRMHFDVSSMLGAPGRNGSTWRILPYLSSRWRHMNVMSNHRSFDCLFNSLCGPTWRKHQSPHFEPFVRGIQQLPVNSPHKGPLTRKNFHLMTSSWVRYVPADGLSPKVLHYLQAQWWPSSDPVFTWDWFLRKKYIDTTHAVEILPQVRQEPTYFTESISCYILELLTHSICGPFGNNIKL